jgi:hypothetical protein
MFKKIQETFQNLTYFQSAAGMLVILSTCSLGYSAALMRVFHGDPNLVGDLEYEMTVAETLRHPDDEVLVDLVKKSCESGDMNHDEFRQIYTYVMAKYGGNTYTKTNVYERSRPTGCEKA